MKKKHSHLAEENTNWKVGKSLNSPRVMVWTALGFSGVIAAIFFDGNVNAVSYLQMIENEFYPQLMALKNSSQIIFQHDGAPLHRARTVRDWLNDNLPNRWIRRRNRDDQRNPWPPRSPYPTLLEYFL